MRPRGPSEFHRGRPSSVPGNRKSRAALAGAGAPRVRSRTVQGLYGRPAPISPGNTRMKCLIRYAVYAVFSTLIAGTASADPIPPQLVGTWRLVSNTLEE